MPPAITYEACLRYLRGAAPLAEARAVRAWLADPANEAQAQEWMSRSVAEATAAAPAATDSYDYNYAQIRANLHARLGLDVRPAPVQPKAPHWRRWALAATLAGATVGATWLWPRPAPRSSVTTAHYATTYGQTRVVQLPDGSVVTLNARSSVRYAAPALASAPREVWLDGEAFFAVKHLPTNQRFVVHTTAGFRVEVLGTRFAVYRRHAQARVVLLSGKVRVAFADSTRPAVVLKPGELLQTSDKHPRALVHKAVQAAAYTSWTANELQFEATPLADLATRLQDTYGVEVVVASPALRQRKFTGTFPMGNLDVLCEDLAEAFHLHVERQRNRLILSSKPLSD
ncbi:FecR family protein [Hymenobacter bucti]|uniref:FecR family protein n=1 Tax=Hymenobacter bucti TaxID=1844114 RepID=A0ABW4QZP5_9BACT